MPGRPLSAMGTNGEAMGKKSGGELEAKKLKKKARAIGGKLLDKAHAKGLETRAVVALCNRCGNAKKAAGELASWLKDRVSSRKDLKQQLAVQQVGCLGPCPKKKKLTVAVGGASAKDWARGFLIDPDQDRQALLSLVLQRLAV